MAALTGQAFYKYELQKYIMAEIERLRSIVTDNLNPIDDYSQYRHHIGIIEGLRRALGLIEEVESIINGAERG